MSIKIAIQLRNFLIGQIGHHVRNHVIGDQRLDQDIVHLIVIISRDMMQLMPSMTKTVVFIDGVVSFQSF